IGHARTAIAVGLLHPARPPDAELLGEFLQAHPAKGLLVLLVLAGANATWRAGVLHVIDMDERPWVSVDEPKLGHLLLVKRPAGIHEWPRLLKILAGNGS